MKYIHFHIKYLENRLQHLWKTDVRHFLSLVKNIQRNTSKTHQCLKSVIRWHLKRLNERYLSQYESSPSVLYKRTNCLVHTLYSSWFFRVQHLFRVQQQVQKTLTESSSQYMVVHRFYSKRSEHCPWFNYSSKYWNATSYKTIEVQNCWTTNHRII